MGIKGVLLRDNTWLNYVLVRYLGLENIVLETYYPNVILLGNVAGHLGSFASCKSGAWIVKYHAW